jgi:hypothetical protein
MHTAMGSNEHNETALQGSEALAHPTDRLVRNWYGIMERPDFIKLLGGFRAKMLLLLKADIEEEWTVLRRRLDAVLPEGVVALSWFGRTLIPLPIREQDKKKYEFGVVLGHPSWPVIKQGGQYETFTLLEAEGWVMADELKQVPEWCSEAARFITGANEGETYEYYMDRIAKVILVAWNNHNHRVPTDHCPRCQRSYRFEEEQKARLCTVCVTEIWGSNPPADVDIDIEYLRALIRDDVPAMQDWRTLFLTHVPRLLDALAVNPPANDAVGDTGRLRAALEAAQRTVRSHVSAVLVPQSAWLALLDLLESALSVPAPSRQPEAPIDMLLFCPLCGYQHVAAENRLRGECVALEVKLSEAVI